MSQTTVKAGIMPGQIREFAVDVGTSVKEVLRIAGLNANGFEVKVDGNPVTDINTATVSSTTNMILLTKQIKGNAQTTVKAGIMPGQIREFAVDVGASIKSVLDLASLNPAGFEVKVDGNPVTDVNAATVSSTTNMILLTKQIKGNK